MPLRAASVAWLLLCASCSLLHSSEPSEVARGEYYSAGRPEYDAYFIGVYSNQVQMLSAPQEPSAARADLLRALGLPQAASDQALGERLREELKQLSARGLRLRLELPEPAAGADASATLYASDDSITTPLRAALADQATRLARSRARMLATKAELEKLSVGGVSLAGRVEESFRTGGPWKRDEVRQNLNDGQKIIVLMQARAQEVLDTDAKLLALLEATVSTDPSLGKTVAATATEAPKPTRRERVAARSATSPAPGKPASGSAPKAAPRSSDEEGAPRVKPTQGSAPAEIEP